MSIVTRLQKIQEDRGAMANLRCISVESKKQRAWPVLSRIGISIQNEVGAFVAGLFAKHPLIASSGNFGQTCKQIETKREGRSEDNKLSATERRFLHLLAAKNMKERLQRILRIVSLAESHQVPVNYGQLYCDLKRWNDSTKQNWAMEFWNTNAD
ncbi:type I-E CRISPR-associated protein Cse2/CasB [Leptospira sp. WS92.C1]